MSRAKIAHLFGEANDFDMRFRNLKKKATPTIDPPTITAPPICQVPLQIVVPIVGLGEVYMAIEPIDTPSLGEQKWKEPTMGTSKRIKRKMEEMSSGVAVKIWKLEFSACELGKQVTVANSA